MDSLRRVIENNLRENLSEKLDIHKIAEIKHIIHTNSQLASCSLLNNKMFLYSWTRPSEVL